jgi:putative ubiquitin-RnfH superfamily antitoxin RatB of RatAB toxin-antitoxin module
MGRSFDRAPQGIASMAAIQAPEVDCIDRKRVVRPIAADPTTGRRASQKEPPGPSIG